MRRKNCKRRIAVKIFVLLLIKFEEILYYIMSSVNFLTAQLIPRRIM